MKNEQVSAAQGGFFVTIVTAASSTTKKVDGDLLTVGRADDCHLTISHETLSRRHLSITMKDGACWVEDHASSNGTFINGKRIAAHSLTRVLPEDQITMGQAGVRLSVSTEALMRKEGSPPMARENTATHISDTIVTSTHSHRREARAGLAVSKPKPKEEVAEQVERLMGDAQKKASSLIQEAELEAERRVEDIYRRAHETQAKMDEVYQKRMNEAYRASEQIYQKSQEEAQKHLDVSRARSNEIRQQAENFVMELRQRTEDDCERMLEEAQQTARDLKEQRLLEAEDIVKKKEAEMVEETRIKMNERVNRFEEELAGEARKQRVELEDELKRRTEDLDRDHNEQIEAVRSLKAELKVLREQHDKEKTQLGDLRTREETQLRETRETEQAKLSTLREAEQTKLASIRDAEKVKLAELRQREEAQLAELRTKEQAKLSELETTVKKYKSEAGVLKDDAEAKKKFVHDANLQLTNLRGVIEKLEKERTSTDAAIRESQVTLAKITEEGRSAQRRVTSLKDQSDAEIVSIRAKFEEDKIKMQKTEQAHFEELKLQTTRKARDLEQGLVDELLGKQDRLMRELALVVESHLKENKDNGARDLQTVMATHFSKQIISLSKDESAKTKQVSLVTLKRRQKIMSVLMGVVVGAIATFGGERALRQMRQEMSPMQRRVVNAQEERKADMELRKFNPPQTRGYKDTYVDNVVYTENFTANYTSDDFQNKFMHALSPYMLKTWKVDEDQTIQLIGMAGAMVKALAEKKTNIHPDFVQQGLEKMKDAENEATGRMRTLLGSQVRLESFKKFEKQFYEKYEPVANPDPGTPRAPSAATPTN